MNNLREALSQMWEQRHWPAGFVRTKLSDMAALVSAFVALALTIGLTALSKETPMTAVLGWFGLRDVPGLGVGLQLASWVVSLLISWMLFTWIIARCPASRSASAARCGRVCWPPSRSRSSSRWPRSICSRC
jgi:membrane protein